MAVMKDVAHWLLFWGKARAPGGSAQPFHPIVAHALDVAAVALRLDRAAPIGLAPEMLALLIAIHDIGKFSRAFQAKAPQAWPASVLGPPGPVEYDPGHDSTGYAMLREGPMAAALAPLFPGWRPGQVAALLRAVTGHHGRPPREDARLTGKQIGRQCSEAAMAFLHAMRALFAPQPLRRPGGEAEVQALAWRLAGLTTLADWIGSSVRYFPYAAPEALADPRRYWDEQAGPRADAAIAALGLAPARPAPFRGMAQLFPRIERASPLQAWASGVALPDGPLLAICEDMTGAGKTEAALLFAHRLLAAGRADGVFVALPTMATANAMYRRMAESYRRLFAEGAAPSLALAHGRAALDAGFTASILADAADPDAPAGDDPASESAGAQCAAWLADDRRKALLAQVGVGTIDQALLAVLPVRHAPLRQRGLSRKVLVVDEAHAFDPYMREELARLLLFYAALGGCAILLSATLPMALRQRLADAWRSGIGIAPAALGETAYPLATLVAGEGVAEAALPPRPGTARQVDVTRIADAEEAIARIRDAAGQGAAVAWVRNTVDEAIAAAEALRAAGLEPLLFHARFAMVDRLRIEDEVLRRFGPDAPPGVRRGVLVATQVIEQSLDIDFDLLVTDLAPADLLIQRAGRLWRHGRRDARPLPKPELLVLAPEAVAAPGADWLAAHRGTAAVYRDPALLWRGARALFAAGEIASPGGVRDLIEAAADGEQPEGLSGAADAAAGKRLTDAAVARQNLLDFAKGYAEGAGLWASDERTPTRLEERPQVTLRLALLRDGQVVPYATDADERRAWALSEVSVAAHRIGEVTVPPACQAAADQARARWGRWEREAPTLKLLLLMASGARWIWSGGRGQYDAASGLIIDDPSDPGRPAC